MVTGLGDRMHRLRLATPVDIPELGRLTEQSVRALSVGYYTGPQVESALRHVFRPDTQLIADQTYYVVEDEAGPRASTDRCLLTPFPAARTGVGLA
jgi:hypothetical protein